MSWGSLLPWGYSWAHRLPGRLLCWHHSPEHLHPLWTWLLLPRQLYHLHEYTLPHRWGKQAGLQPDVYYPWFMSPHISGLTHWGRVTHICVGKLIILGSDNGLSPGRRQAIIWTNAGILLIGPLGTNFSEILIRIQTFSFKKMHLKMSSAKWRLFCLGLNELMQKRCNCTALPMELRLFCIKPAMISHLISCHLISTNLMPMKVITGKCIYTFEVKAWSPRGPVSQEPGCRLNIKMSSYQNRDPHDKDKTVPRLSYL